jgi:hypothetical protein
MRGLDPRIHHSSRNAFSEADGLPVKPGNDANWPVATGD